MDLALFQYSYPKELIAQVPLPERDSSRMMVLNRGRQTWEHNQFKNFPDYLHAGDLLVLNDTKVFPARLFGKDEKNRAIEILLLRTMDHELSTIDYGPWTMDQKTWVCLAKPFKKIGVGAVIQFDGGLQGRVTEKTDGFLKMVFEADDFERRLEEIGFPPLPPYIKRDQQEWKKEADKNRYQTVFAKHLGSAAAPTASFHFTENLLEQIQKKGMEIATVTLHVSTDTFLPVRENDIRQHKMHGERFSIPEQTATKVLKAKKEGRRVIGVGTTAVRALESDWTKPATDIFIYPGYSFKIVDAMLTNFHQPSSTPLLMISALAGREWVLQAYEEAIKQRYRLFSYGDCMLIL